MTHDWNPSVGDQFFSELIASEEMSATDRLIIKKNQALLDEVKHLGLRLGNGKHYFCGEISRYEYASKYFDLICESRISDFDSYSEVRKKISDEDFLFKMDDFISQNEIEKIKNENPATIVVAGKERTIDYRESSDPNDPDDELFFFARIYLEEQELLQIEEDDIRLPSGRLVWVCLCDETGEALSSLRKGLIVEHFGPIASTKQHSGPFYRAFEKMLQQVRDLDARYGSVNMNEVQKWFGIEYYNEFYNTHKKMHNCFDMGNYIKAQSANKELDALLYEIPNLIQQNKDEVEDLLQSLPEWMNFYGDYAVSVHYNVLNLKVEDLNEDFLVKAPLDDVWRYLLEVGGDNFYAGKPLYNFGQQDIKNIINYVLDIHFPLPPEE